MALDTFIAGRYTDAYNGVDVGITDNGTEVQQDSAWETIGSSDAYGDSVIDGIFRGGNCHLQFVCKAYKAGSIAPFWPWGALGVMQTTGGGSPAPLGRRASDVAASLVMTAVAGTPAAVLGAVNTLTAGTSILAPNSPATLLFTNRLRQVPIRLFALPYETTSGGVTTTKWFVTT